MFLGYSLETPIWKRSQNGESRIRHVLLLLAPCWVQMLRCIFRFLERSVLRSLGNLLLEEVLPRQRSGALVLGSFLVVRVRIPTKAQDSAPYKQALGCHTATRTPRTSKRQSKRYSLG